MGVVFILVFIVLFFTLTSLNQHLKTLRVNKRMIEMYGSPRVDDLVQKEINKVQNLITFVVLGLIACFIAYLIFILNN